MASAIGIIKLKRTVYCEVCGCSHTRTIKVKIYNNNEEEINAAKVEATKRAKKSYTCRVCKSIEKETKEMKEEVIETPSKTNTTEEFHKNGMLAYTQTTEND